MVYIFSALIFPSSYFILAVHSTPMIFSIPMTAPSIFPSIPIFSPAATIKDLLASFAASSFSSSELNPSLYFLFLFFFTLTCTSAGSRISSSFFPLVFAA
jgi:hypothetical protein